MFHLDNTSGVPDMPEPKEPLSNTPRWFGESVQQGGVSWPGADWFNIVQAELLNTLKNAGIPSEKGNMEQLSSAMEILGGRALRQEIYKAVFESPVSGEDDSFDDGSFGQYVVANFKTVQYIQHYYDIIGDWDAAIYQAQLNVYLKGYSPVLILPNIVIRLKKPILGSVALGDRIHQDHPELNFYDASTGRYKATWPLIIRGVFRKQQDGGIDTFNGTQIVFSGAYDTSDRTWMNYGIIHCAPTEVDQIRQTAPILKKWPGYADLRDFNIRGINKDESRFPLVHGVVIHNGTQCYLQNVTAYNLYGAGILFDWAWDSLVDNCKVIQCGRMSPAFGQYLMDGNLSAEYQTYAPLHVLRSKNTDNSNFIRFKNMHVEDCYHGTADMIVSGNSSPVWLEDSHFETDTAAGVAASSKKLRVALGNYGVTYFGQDSEASFDYTNRPDTKTGGYLIWRGGATYVDGYEDLLHETRYSGAIIEGLRVPNTGGIKVFGGNSVPYVILQNCTVGNIALTGGNGHANPLIMDNCDCGDITTDYVKALRLSNVRGRNLRSTNNFSDESCPTIFDGCTFATMSGVYNYAMGKVHLTSKTVPSSLLVKKGHVEIASYAWFRANVLGE
ncbi:hypothetical protein [Serratia marcescens]|uniref:hypothetical protein n=3 Tax=Serratia marcescens TaxID=615 RepID=UPI002FD96086